MCMNEEKTHTRDTLLFGIMIDRKRSKPMNEKKKTHYAIHIEYPKLDKENSIDIPVEGNHQGAQDLKEALDVMFPDNRHTVKERTEK